jgi:hypothetical protein
LEWFSGNCRPGLLATAQRLSSPKGVTANGNCRLRDLIPDSAGVALGAGALLLLYGALRRIPVFLRSRQSDQMTDGRRRPALALSYLAGGLLRRRSAAAPTTASPVPSSMSTAGSGATV